ncbi:hypothetical protein SAMN05421858_4133 [Haladaptatus litoreus]|uniref:Uncharacterized protein n=1 Tax=Haladaptatus litoreus TaxID=553468 RepID=A0A1N7E8Z2_9EURY|nr:hypothetical protein [Haladaptatus litoreus]SIR84622.1 hypothetical protein SAMN05421858_4133 [Haladaptatus litoreus]
MGHPTNYLSRRQLLAGGTVLLTGAIASGVAQRTTSSTGGGSQSATGSQLLVENPTEQPHQFSLSVSNRPISAYRITSRDGKTETIELGNEDGDEDFPFPVLMQAEARAIKPASNVIFDREYSIPPDSAHSFLLEGMPEQGELLYTLRESPKSADEATVVESWGTMGCDSRFEVYFTPSETRSSCGSPLPDVDEPRGAKQHTIELQGASQ